MIKLIKLTFLALISISTALAGEGDADPLAGVIAKYGEVKRRVAVGVGGLTAWVVEKNGQQMTLYTTPDGQAVIAGVIWEATTARNVSDRFAAMAKKPSANGRDHRPASSVPANTDRFLPGGGLASALNGAFPKKMPESMTTVDNLSGIKEGKGGIEDTVYIMIDPRCPYCQKAYAASRRYVAAGKTIKWIPVLALGDAEGGAPRAAALIQSPDPKRLDKVLVDKTLTVVPSKETQAALAKNHAFLFAAFEQSGGQAGVPVAFFFDRRTQQARMMTGVSESEVLRDIFGDI